MAISAFAYVNSVIKYGIVVIKLYHTRKEPVAQPSSHIRGTVVTAIGVSNDRHKNKKIGTQ